MMEGLCAGLAHAHRADIVHRDIKPANLMVDGEGDIKVLDFGIVSMAGSGLTHQGVLVGTVNYMSPEQIAGELVDHRSDVFAVGTVFYELFALSALFPARWPRCSTRSSTPNPTRSRSLCPGLDPAIERAVHRCLEKSPDRRYQDLTHLKRDLARIRQRLELEADSSATIVPRDVAVQGPPPQPDTVSPILGEAQAALDAQDLDRAVALAERAFALAPEDARAKQILEKAQRTRQSRALAGALNRAQSALSRKDFAGARQAVDEALGADPENAVALGVQREVENALSELRRLEAHERAALEAIAQARRLFDADRHAEALDRLERFAPPHPQVTHALAGLRARQDELDRARKVREARVHRVNELLAAARKALAGDDLDRAQAAVHEAANLDADVTQIAVVRKAVEDRTRDLQRLAQWLRDGETLLGRGELQGAMQLVQEALRVRPGDPAATALGGRVQQALDERRIEDERRRAEETRQRQIEAWLEEARAAPDDEQAMALLDRIFEVAPAHGDARRLLDDVRRRQEERLRARRDRVGQGKRAADEGRFAEALAILRPLAKESAQDSGFAQLMQQVEAGAARAEAERRLQEKQTATLQEAVDKAARDEFAAARALIQSVLAQQPTHQRARALLGEVLKGEEQLTRASGSVEKALALFERGDHGDAIGLLAGVTPPHPLVAATLTQLRTRLAEIERARRRAEQRQQYSRTVRSMGALLRSLALDRRLQLLLVVTLASVAAWRYWPEQGPPQGPRHRATSCCASNRRRRRRRPTRPARRSPLAPLTRVRLLRRVRARATPIKGLNLRRNRWSSSSRQPATRLRLASIPCRDRSPRETRRRSCRTPGSPRPGRRRRSCPIPECRRPGRRTRRRGPPIPLRPSRSPQRRDPPILHRQLRGESRNRRRSLSHRPVPARRNWRAGTSRTGWVSTPGRTPRSTRVRSAG